MAYLLDRDIYEGFLIATRPDDSYDKIPLNLSDVSFSNSLEQSTESRVTTHNLFKQGNSLPKLRTNKQGATDLKMTVYPYGQWFTKVLESIYKADIVSLSSQGEDPGNLQRRRADLPISIASRDTTYSKVDLYLQRYDYSTWLRLEDISGGSLSLDASSGLVEFSMSLSAPAAIEDLSSNPTLTPATTYASDFQYYSTKGSLALDYNSSESLDQLIDIKYSYTIGSTYTKTDSTHNATTDTFHTPGVHSHSKVENEIFVERYSDDYSSIYKGNFTTVDATLANSDQPESQLNIKTSLAETVSTTKQDSVFVESLTITPLEQPEIYINYLV